MVSESGGARLYLLTRDILIAIDNANGYHTQLSPLPQRQVSDSAMYICLCNGLTDRDIRRAAAAGDGSVAQLYRSLGCAPRCGKCVPTVREMVAERSAGSNGGA